MSRFKTIQLSTEPVSKDNYINFGRICEDNLFLERSDYGGDPVEDEKEAIEILKKDLKGIGEVDVEKRTLTFRPKKEILEDYKQFVKRLYKEHKKFLKEGCIQFWRFHRELEDFGAISDIFYINFCITPSYLVQDYINGYLPDVLHIGAILDAHC